MASVHDLTREQLVEELLGCYKMFRVCKSLLGGVDAESIELTDTKELNSDDLELYYACKRVCDNGKAKKEICQ